VFCINIFGVGKWIFALWLVKTPPRKCGRPKGKTKNGTGFLVMIQLERKIRLISQNERVQKSSVLNFGSADYN
jgi:hypothetical protein